MNNESTDSNKNEIGVPNQVRRENAAGAISDNQGTIAQGGNATLHDRLGVYLAVVAVLVAGMGLGYEISQSSSRAEIRELQEKTLQAQIQAGVSKAETEANEAKVTARIALDTVKSVCAGIKANGIKNVDCH